MSAERFARLKKIVLAASGLPEAERAAYLDRACGEDRGLRREAESLLAHEADPPTLARTGGLGERLGGGGPADHPERIGPYEILGTLGQGGMGVVYRARQEVPIRREVAIKLVRRGMDSGRIVARFEAERQSLALMDHPHIARILDAGQDEHGRSYFVMELVWGTPVTQFCDESDLALGDRLNLVQLICRAVQHAHQRGIIHRDLKPSNVLVTRQDGTPVPKVIDFGIAKAIEDTSSEATLLTHEGQIVGTLAYMSPEQARGATREVDTRSDVYSLGAVLYELLTGALPYDVSDSSLGEQVRRVCERSPRPFREASPGHKIDADLETITLKALAKEPELRYQSVAALGDDIERYQASLPILARPPHATYQLRKLIARNPVPSALVGGIAAILVAFAIGMSILYARSEANLRRALHAEGEAKQVSGFMVGLFDISHPGEARGSTVTAREVLDAGAGRIERELKEQPQVQARMMRAMGETYLGLGLHEEAASLLDAALARNAGPAEGERLERAILQSERGRLHEALGELAAAESCYVEAHSIRNALLAPDAPDVAVALANLGRVHAWSGRLQEAERLLGDAVAILEGAAGRGALELRAVLSNLGRVMWRQARYEEAETLLRRSVALGEEILPPDHPDLAASLNDLSTLLWNLGRFDEALDPATRSLDIRERSLGPDHPDYGAALMNLSALQQDLGEIEMAEGSLTRAISILEASFGSAHPDVAIGLNNLGVLYRALGRPRDGEAALRRSLEIQEELSGADHPTVSTPLNNLGELFLAESRLDEAEERFRRALALREAAYGADNPQTALPMHNLGVLLMERGRFAVAESLLTKAMDVREKTLGPAHPRIAESREACADLYRRLGRPEEAEELERRAASLRDQLSR